MLLQIASCLLTMCAADSVSIWHHVCQVYSVEYYVGDLAGAIIKFCRLAHELVFEDAPLGCLVIEAPKRIAHRNYCTGSPRCGAIQFCSPYAVAPLVQIAWQRKCGCFSMWEQQGQADDQSSRGNSASSWCTAFWAERCENLRAQEQQIILKCIGQMLGRHPVNEFAIFDELYSSSRDIVCK